MRITSYLCRYCDFIKRSSRQNRTSCRLTLIELTGDKLSLASYKSRNRVKDFKKYYRLPATPEEVYIALTNPLTIELWTGEPAEMSVEPGSEFSMWDGSIVGKNLEFEENKKVVQQLYFEGQREESIVTIKLHPDGSETS